MGRYSKVLEALPDRVSSWRLDPNDLQAQLEDVRAQGILSEDRSRFDDWVSYRLSRNLGRRGGIGVAVPDELEKELSHLSTATLCGSQALHLALGLHPSLLIDPGDLHVPVEEAAAWTFYDLDPYTLSDLRATRVHAFRNWAYLAAPPDDETVAMATGEVHMWVNSSLLVRRCPWLRPTSAASTARCDEPYHALHVYLEWLRYTTAHGEIGAALTRYVRHVSDLDEYLAAGLSLEETRDWVLSFENGPSTGARRALDWRERPVLPEVLSWRGANLGPGDVERWNVGHLPDRLGVRGSDFGENHYFGERHSVVVWSDEDPVPPTELARLRDEGFTGWKTDEWLAALRVAGCATVGELVQHGKTRTDAKTVSSTFDELVETARVLVREKRLGNDVPAVWARQWGRGQE